MILDNIPFMFLKIGRASLTDAARFNLYIELRASKLSVLRPVH